MIFFTILVTSALAHIPDHHRPRPDHPPGPPPHGPPPPEFLRNLTREAQREFFEILHNETLTFAEIDEEATKWASENNISDVFANFQQNHTKMEEQENQNVTTFIEHLKTVQGLINNITTNKNQTRDEKHKAIEELKKKNPWEVDTILHIRHSTHPRREDEGPEDRDQFPPPPFPEHDPHGRFPGPPQGNYQYNWFSNRQQQRVDSQPQDFQDDNQYGQQEVQRGFQLGLQKEDQFGSQGGRGFQPRPQEDDERRGPQGGRGGFQPGPEESDRFGPLGGRGFQPRPQEDDERRGPQGGRGFQPGPEESDRFGPQGGRGFQPRPQEDDDRRGTQGGRGFQPRPQEDDERRGPQGGRGFQPGPEESDRFGPQGGRGFQPRPQEDDERRGPQGGRGFQPGPEESDRFGPQGGRGFQPRPQEDDDRRGPQGGRGFQPGPEESDRFGPQGGRGFQPRPQEDDDRRGPQGGRGFQPRPQEDDERRGPQGGRGFQPGPEESDRFGPQGGRGFQPRPQEDDERRGPQGGRGFQPGPEKSDRFGTQRGHGRFQPGSERPSQEDEENRKPHNNNRGESQNEFSFQQPTGFSRDFSGFPQPSQYQSPSSHREFGDYGRQWRFGNRGESQFHQSEINFGENEQNNYKSQDQNLHQMKLNTITDDETSSSLNML